MDKNKGGRPIKDEDEKRSHRITVHLRPAEYTIIKNKAHLARSNLSCFLRDSALKKEVKSYENLINTIVELKRVGNNLNQVAKVMNTDPNQFSEDLKNRLQSFMNEFKLIMSQIINLKH